MKLRNILFVLVSLIFGCSGGTNSRDAGSGRLCIPGTTLACVGPMGCSGFQVCNAAGSGYEACNCGGSGGVDGSTNNQDGGSAANDTGMTGVDGSTSNQDGGSAVNDTGMTSTDGSTSNDAGMMSGPACNSSFQIDFVNGEQLQLNPCVYSNFEAELDFSPTAPPEVRSFDLSLSNFQSGSNFHCRVEIQLSGGCGENGGLGGGSKAV